MDSSSDLTTVLPQVLSKKKTRAAPTHYDWTVVVADGKPMKDLTQEQAQAFLAAEGERQCPGATWRPEAWRIRKTGLPPGALTMHIRQHRCAWSAASGVNCKYVLREIKVVYAGGKTKLTVEDGRVPHSDHAAEVPKRGLKKTLKLAAAGLALDFQAKKVVHKLGGSAVASLDVKKQVSPTPITAAKI
jgi:hypothetical protein